MDQRNADGGEPAGPVPVENARWDAFADDRLGLMSHFGIREFLFRSHMPMRGAAQ